MNYQAFAGVAQLVERNLAKVEVASSSLVSRSKSLKGSPIASLFVSTIALIELTNRLNEYGLDATFYGPHAWHLNKCKSGILNNSLIINNDDILICHFLQLANRPNAKKVILACHEKNLFEVGKIKQYWDEVVFLNLRHREYHHEYINKFTIIPNLKQNFETKDKTGLEKIAGIIGSFDENKQTHISIQTEISLLLELSQLT